MLFRKSSLALICLLLGVALQASQRAPVIPFEIRTWLTPGNRVDELVLGQTNSCPASYGCSDAVFLRRVYLDVIGTLPTAREAAQFLAGTDPQKRAKLIEDLLQREEYADYWAMKWSDVLRIKAEFPINLWPNAAQAYHHWVRTALQENMPYDRFARSLLISSGSNFRVPQVNFYRAMQSREPQGVAQTVALTLMGVRAENWPKERLAGMSCFFSKIGYKQTAEWKEEIVFYDSASTNDVSAAKFPDGTPAHLNQDVDPRQAFADWLVTRSNPWFTRNIANRVWCWLMGRGIIHEPDDIRPDNPPASPALLSYLESELIEHQYDLKHLYRMILNSRTYQRSSIPADGSKDVTACFACYSMRRLEAEVLADALNQVTGTTEQYTSAIPEPFTFVPQDKRSIALPDGSISSSFLELFGRASRDTGLDSERNNRPTAAQSLHLLNSSHIQRKLEESPKLQTLLQSKASQRDIVSGVYLMILSRYPTEQELETIQMNLASGSAKDRETLMDLVWALVNSAEFLFRH